MRPFEIGWDYTRVAVLQYSDDPRIEFFLKDYQDKTTLLDAIDSIPYKGSLNINVKRLTFDKAEIRELVMPSDS